MDKQAFKVDMGTVGRYAAGGAVTGASTAALLNLVHLLREQRKEQLAKGDEAQTDKDTIVLNLPPKMGEFTTKLAFQLAEESTVSNDVMHDHGKPGFRHTRGKRTGGRWTNPIGKKDKSEKAVQEPAEVKDESNKDMSEPEIHKAATGWPTLTMSALAAMGGAGAGVALVDKLYQMRREKQLKDELQAAQQEYMTRLTSGKQACALDTLFPLGLGKQADIGDPTFGMLNYPIAAAALLTLMGTGGTAYITKRILDEKLREAQGKGLDIPRVKRIVFRSSPSAIGSPDEEQDPTLVTKKASEQDMLNIKAAMFIMLDKLDTHSKVLNIPAVKEAQAKAGLPTGHLFNLQQGEIGTIMDALDQNPALAKIIVQHGMAQRPIMKHFQWAANTAPGLAMGKHGIRSFLERFMAPKAPAVQVPKPAMPMKAGAALDTIAALVAGKVMGSTTADATRALLDNGSQDSDTEVTTGKPKTDLSKVKIDATDPKAKAYVNANKQKLIKLLQTMSDEGKI